MTSNCSELGQPDAMSGRFFKLVSIFKLGQVSLSQVKIALRRFEVTGLNKKGKMAWKPGQSGLEA